MPHTRPPYPAEFRRQIVELVRVGRDPTDLAREFEPSAQAIRNWVAQADRTEGRREAKAETLTAAEREELSYPSAPRGAPTATGAGYPVTSRGLVRAGDRRGAVGIVRFMSANRATFPIAVMARVLGVSEAGYHAWRQREPSAHAQADTALLKRIRTIHTGSGEAYGAPRVHAELAAEGSRHGRKRIARLMRAGGLVGASRRRDRIITTRRDKDARPAPDLVDRNFRAEGPNQLWVGDITYLPTAAGFLYLAVVLDAWSRRIVGWAMANHLRTELVLDALEMAIGQRKPSAVIHHSDQGSQYTVLAFGNRCREAGVRPSMGSVGDAYDNAMAESFFATLECELLDRRRFASQAQARMAVFTFIEGFYNPVRRHSAPGYRSPIRYENEMLTDPLPAS